MGQKSSPIGLRLGLHRKWASSWTLSAHSSSKVLSPVIGSRGGEIRSGIEETIYSIVTRQPLSITKARKDQTSSVSINYRLFPIDLRITVSASGSLFIIIFYSKLSTKN